MSGGDKELSLFTKKNIKKNKNKKPMHGKKDCFKILTKMIKISKRKLPD